MKHNFLFTIFILLVGILFGCGRKQDEISQEFTMPSSILESKEMIGENGTLYYIPNENIEAGFMQNIISFQDNFLLYRISDEATGLNLKLISSQTGEVIAESTLLDIELPNIQTCGNQLAISDWEDGKIVLLNDRLQEITKYKVTSEYNSIYLSPDVKKAYVFTPDKGLQITNLSQGEMETKLEEAVNLFVSVECGMNVTFTYTDRKTQRDQYGVLNLQTGEITESPFKGSFYDIQYVNDVWMASNSDAMNIRYFVMDKDMKKFESSDDFGFMTIHPETVNLITTYYDDNGLAEMNIYDESGGFLSNCENNIEGASIQGGLIWSEADNGYFFIMTDSEAKDRLMFWDMGTQVSGTDIIFEEVKRENLPENAVSKELYTKAKAIGYKHGIEIRIAEQMDGDYNDYKVEKNLDESQINTALDILGRELSVYPEGYFDQLLYGSIYEIELHLAGTLTNLAMPEGDVNGFTSYSGFAQTRNGKAVIVFDINEGDNLAKFIHHEIFHLTDDKLSFDAMIRPDAMYSEEDWIKLNPEGFEYAGSTFELPEEIYNEEYDVWFIDIYSRTMSREDRARIMEYAMIGDYNMFIAAPHRQAKLKYLNQCIRDAFDTFGWPEKTMWEETLEKSY